MRDVLVVTTLSKPSKYWYFIEKKRCQNRQIHKANILKGGKIKSS